MFFYKIYLYGSAAPFNPKQITERGGSGWLYYLSYISVAILQMGNPMPWSTNSFCKQKSV